MSFAHPEYLWLLLLLPLIALAGWWSTLRRRAALARFAAIEQRLQLLENVGARPLQPRQSQDGCRLLGG